MTDHNLDPSIAMLVNRVRKNHKRLKPWAARENVSCYRLYDRDIPELPLAIDWYEGNLHIAVYARNEKLIPDEQLDAMTNALADELHICVDNVFIKCRQQQKENSQYEKVDSKKARIIVHEGPLQFWVNFSDYIDTGLFLDHRRTRKIVANKVNGKRFLNLFSYTGAFTVHAAAAGARSTTSVDLSNTYLRWTEENLLINGLESEHNHIFRDDVLDFLDNHRPMHDGYEVVVVDPPTISRSKRMEKSFHIQRDHVALLNGTLAICAPGAQIYFSTNFHKFKFDSQAIEGASMMDITHKTIPFDFRDKRIHRCWLIIKDGS